MYTTHYVRWHLRLIELLAAFMFIQVQLDREPYEHLRSLKMGSVEIESFSGRLMLDNTLNLVRVEAGRSEGKLRHDDLIKDRTILDLPENDDSVSIIWRNTSCCNFTAPALFHYLPIVNFRASRTHSLLPRINAVPDTPEFGLEGKFVKGSWNGRSVPMFIEHKRLPNLKPFCRSHSVICEHSFEHRMMPFRRTPVKLHVAHLNVSSSLRPTHIPRNIYSSTRGISSSPCLLNGREGGSERLIDEERSHRGYDQAEQGNKQAQQGILSHVLLCGQIIFAALILAAGVYHLAFARYKRASADTLLFYGVLGSLELAGGFLFGAMLAFGRGVP